MYGTGYPASSDETFEGMLEQYNTLLAGVRLFAAKNVREALEPLTDAFRDLGDEMARSASGGASAADAFTKAYLPHRKEILRATADLTDAMRADVTRDIVEQ